MCGWPSLWATEERGRYNILFSDCGSVGDRPFVYILLESAHDAFHIIYFTSAVYRDNIHALNQM